MHLEIALQPKQDELSRLCYQSQATWIGDGGARGGAKSGACRRVMLDRRMTFPNTWGMIVRRVYDDVKKDHIDKFWKEYPELERFYVDSDHAIVLPNKSRIWFGYAETLKDVERKFHGPEYMDVFVDQAEQFTEKELRLMKLCNRWPGMPDYACKFVLFFNPKGVGLQFLKRVFHDRKYMGNEKPEDYAFIRAYGWDNVEWARPALTSDGLTENDFYAWSEEQRFKYFVERTQYGRELNALPESERVGELLGEFDRFAGQYFGSVFDRDKTVMGRDQIVQLVKPWWSKWISIDWGFQHYTAVGWNARGQVTADELRRVARLISPKSPVDTIVTYRAEAFRNMGERAIAEEIVGRCTEEEKNQIAHIFISPDARQKRGLARSVADQMGDVFVQHGMPRPINADTDRVGGWRLMYNQLKEASDCQMVA